MCRKNDLLILWQFLISTKRCCDNIFSSLIGEFTNVARCFVAPHHGIGGCREQGGRGGEQRARHVVTVSHPDGRVTSVTIKSEFSPEEGSVLKWQTFFDFKADIGELDFNALRKEATLVLKHFIGDPLPLSHNNCPIVPDFWSHLKIFIFASFISVYICPK